MEIKKADSKGRVTGFDPQTYYQVVHERNGTISLYPVREGFAEWLKTEEKA